MDATDLENYSYQLSQVKEALKKDPANSELVSLQSELENLIDLTRQLIGAPAASTSTAASATASTSKAKPAEAKPKRQAPAAQQDHLLEDGSVAAKLKAGDDCMARWSKDGKFYAAKITSVGGSAAQPVYGVRFAADGTTELASAADVKPMSESKKRALEAEKATLDVEKERKRKKAEKKESTKAEREADMKGKQSSWQNFAKKGAKKGVSIPGLAGTSMFATPSNPYAKVGVVGGGRGMTPSVAPTKQKFSE